MRVRSITTCALGLAAALSFASTLAAQQDTTRRRTTQSSTRIPISKESPGEVVTVRVDTVYVTRYDTVRTTLTRVDTVTVTPPAPPMLIAKARAMYWGIEAGPTRPYGNIDRIYTNGFHGGGVLGWESQQSPFGVRLDAGVTQIGREETLNSVGFTSAQIGSGTPLWMHVAADVKIKPVNLSGWALYLLGGVNVNRYKGIAMTSSNSQGPNDFFIRGESFENASTSWQNAVGFNFGIGTDFHIGSQDMFLEYRYIAARSNSSNSYLNPISIGVRYF